MLARFGGSDRNRLVQHVRRADHDDVDVVVGDQVVPVDGAVTKAEVGDGLIDPRRHVVADHHQFGVELAPGNRVGIRRIDRVWAWPIQPKPTTPTRIFLRALTRNGPPELRRHGD